jgi:tRNA-Thr(GGU) m(6)t(6)A37 methyltransferase TsaA
MRLSVVYKSIGFIRTPFKSVTNMPVQPCGHNPIEGYVELDKSLEVGLAHLEGFSHIILIYHFHKVKGHKLYVVPFMDKQPHGIFATRAPVRPNAVGLSVVKLIRIEGHKVWFEGADMLDRTPLIDIKPFFPQSDNQPDATSGWLTKSSSEVGEMRSDTRFAMRNNQGSTLCEP